MRVQNDYSLSQLSDLISRVESLINGDTSSRNKYILQQKSFRFLNVNSLKKALYNKWEPGERNAYMRLLPDRPKTALRLLYEAIFKKVAFFSSADIIVIRSNISLFYLSQGMRIKLYMPGGVRSLVDFKNEIHIRQQIENSSLLHVPQILSYNLEREPFFFIDKIIFGDLLSRNHPRVPLIFQRIIPQMWQFYESNGIRWQTLKDLDIDLNSTIERYRLKSTKMNAQLERVDLDKIADFGNRLLPCSLIHGDLNIKNIIVTSNKNYILDWETARTDFIIFDFLPLLIHKNEWKLQHTIDRLMQKEISEQFGSSNNDALNLSEQIMLANFLKKNN